MRKIAGKPSVIKQANRILVIELIKSNPMITKPMLAEMSNLSLVTINKVVEDLIRSGDITSVSEGESTGGRKAMRYIINKNLGLVLTALIRNQKFYFSMLNMVGEPVLTTKYHCKENYSDELCNHIEKLLMNSDIPVIAIGIAVPGTTHLGKVSNIPSITQWEKLNLEKYLNEKFNIPVVIENDINASTIGVHDNYSDANVRNMIFMYIHKGIGAGVVIEDKLYRSKRNFAGELAYMNICGQSDEMSLEKQINYLLEQKEIGGIIDIVAKLLVNTVCVIDPDLIVIDSPYLTQDNLEEIKAEFKMLLNEEYLPNIQLTNLNEAIYQRGMYLQCMNKIQGKVRIYS